MVPKRFLLGCTALVALSGCIPTTDAPVTNPPAASAPSELPPRETRTARETSTSRARAKGVEASWETDRDRKFAGFLQDKSGGMLRKAAVGLDKGGILRVELDQSVAPEDTLELTRSLLAGARNDFPDRPITISVFDPAGEPILKARYQPGQGVQYQVVHDRPGPASPLPDRASASDPGGPADLTARPGVAQADRKFATWAEEHGRSYLRYVEADLEKHGRLWFGVTREVKPADVPQLTRSLLEGAQKEFPRRELVATVFDPDGERIGKAHLGSDGQIRWEP